MVGTWCVQLLVIRKSIEDGEMTWGQTMEGSGGLT